MKNYLLLLLAVPFLLMSCSDDDEGFANSELVYGSVNETAPTLPAGTFLAAARFPGSITSDFSGRDLDVVEFWLDNVPESVSVIVYGEGTSGSPGNILYSADVTNDVSAFRWNTHALDIPVTINGDDLWIAIEVEHESSYGSIGCDPGPAVTNGDWLLDQEFTSQWETFRDFTNGSVSINWNIVGYVTD